jgi:hypothetical protein
LPAGLARVLSGPGGTDVERGSDSGTPFEEGLPVSRADELLPAFDYSEAVEAHVAAPPARAFEAALAVSVSEMWLSAALLTLRGLPGMVRQRRLPRWGSAHPFWEQMLRTPGFTALIEPRDGYAAFGYVGRPWKPAAEGRDVTAAEFANFDEPGWAKVVMDLSATASRGGTLLRTETRIHLTDEGARRAFGRYWAVVRYGSNAVRRDWLRAARRRAGGGA